MAELYNADRIVEYCQWFKRRKINDEYDHHSVEALSSVSIQSYIGPGITQSSHMDPTANNNPNLKSTKAAAGSSNDSAGKSLASVTPQKSKR